MECACAREGERKVDPLFPVLMDISCAQQKNAGSKCGLRGASHGLRGGSPGWVRRRSWEEEGGRKGVERKRLLRCVQGQSLDDLRVVF